MKRSGGFTLTELVMVIVILSVVSLVSVRFISFSTQGAIDTAERQTMAAGAGILAERISRELREALPASLRTHDDGRCVEFIPILRGGGYQGSLTEPVNRFRTRGEAATPVTGRVAVYPYSLSPYDPDNPGSVSIEEATWDLDQVAFPEGVEQRFLADSPRSRFAMIATPVTFCQSAGGRMERFSGYPPGASFGSGERQVVASGLADTGGAPVFRVAEPSLTRNALVILDLRLAASRGDETYQLAQEVQIRNVP
ncbi:MAG: type II secretion system protein [Oleiphilaceae bacterium]|nr:type II secretion system protein [Oleiphilaceae bacterium]